MGAAAVLEVSGGIQAIFGGKADIYSQQINQIIENGEMLHSSLTKSILQREDPVLSGHQTEVMMAVVTGELINISEVNDPIFSTKTLGEGYAIVPLSGDVFAPVYGEVRSIFKTKHAIGLTSSSGLDILIHMGIDTVELNGEPFDILIKEGDKVTPNTPLAKVDIEEIRNSQKDPVVIVAITNTLESVERFDLDVSNHSKVVNKQAVGRIVFKGA